MSPKRPFGLGSGDRTFTGEEGKKEDSRPFGKINLEDDCEQWPCPLQKGGMVAGTNYFDLIDHLTMIQRDKTKNRT